MKINENRQRYVILSMFYKKNFQDNIVIKIYFCTYQ